MKRNERARKVIADHVDGAEIEAIVAFSHLSGASSAHDGVVQGGSSIFATPYAVERRIDLDDRRLRADLLQSWCALTPSQLVFCAPHRWSVRPRPGSLIESIDRSGTTLRWATNEGLSTVTRLFHLEFADGRHLLTATLVRARIRRTNYNDEPDLFVRAFGSDATEFTLS